MTRTALGLILISLLGCDPPAPPAPPRKAEAPVKPLQVTARDIGPQLEGKLVEMTGTRVGVSTVGWRKYFEDDFYLLVSIKDENIDTFDLVAADKHRWGGYLLQSPRGKAIRVIGRVGKASGKWMIFVDKII